jgi:hypothetical protein
MTKEEVMRDADLNEQEFEDLYSAVLGEIRSFGTHGVQTMLNYLEQELTEGREHVE